MFMLLFLTTGIGNGSTFRMIPVIFLTERQREAAGKGPDAQRAGDPRRQQGRRRRARLLRGDRRVRRLLHSRRATAASISLTGGPEFALYCFIVFYLTCIAMTWWYLRAAQRADAVLNAP